MTKNCLLNGAVPPITSRGVPPVAGLDLTQAISFVSEEGIPLAWFYECYTYPKTFYTKGSRPELERIVEENVTANASDSEKVDQVLDFLTRNMRHPMHLTKDFRADLHSDFTAERALREEELIKSGWGWCNEQSRAFVALTQTAGIPSKMLFAFLPDKSGHVVAEVLADGKWGIVDQTSGFAFRDDDGKPVNVRDIRENDDVREMMNHKYRAAIVEDAKRAVDGRYVESGTGYCGIPTPIDLFHKVGYLNYFIT